MNVKLLVAKMNIPHQGRQNYFYLIFVFCKKLRRKEDFLALPAMKERKHDNWLTQISRGFLLLLFSVAEHRAVNISGKRNTYNIEVTCDCAIDI